MKKYFDKDSAAETSLSENDVLVRIADNYIKLHPEKDFYMRPWIDSGIRQEKSGMYNIDFNLLYPNASNGSYAYAYCSLDSAYEINVTVAAEVFSGGEIYFNGKMLVKTTVDDEIKRQSRRFSVKLQKGRNPVFIKAKKTTLGFGVKFGEANISWKPYYPHMPFDEYKEYLGWAVTLPVKNDIYKLSEDIPDINAKMPCSFVKPVLEDKYVFNSGYVYGCTYADVKNDTVLEIECSEKTAVYIDGKCSDNCVIPQGKHYIVTETLHDKSIPFTLEIKKSEDIILENDSLVLTGGKILFMGALQGQDEGIIEKLSFTHMGTTSEGDTFWRYGISNNYLRKLREDDIFGKWTYPIGVVMYGLLSTFEKTKDCKIKDYVLRHMFAIVKNQRYADFDMKNCGVPSINRQPSCLGMLDYCGSCGNAMLACLDYTNDDAQIKMIAKRIAYYIENVQERRDNKMFYRLHKGDFDYNTVWADDLYMSVPFLCRYYKLTGEEKYLHDAVNQILCFKELLYMPDLGLMSHVYNISYGKITGIAWGRGNGWALFAITELLDSLPEDFEDREKVLAFYNEFCKNVSGYADECGMYHQVLNEKDSYVETSCSAMFTYSFAKGYRSGWLRDKRFCEYAKQTWDSICRYCVDCDGNVYGVCCGSAYSFRSEYYKDELPWIKNDTHGIGIVLLAGNEVAKLS